MSKVRVATDHALPPPDEFDLPSMTPLGRFVPHLPGRDYCLVSFARGLLGFFDDTRMAQSFLRMLVFNADRNKGKHDFRLYKWSEKDNGWAIEQRTILMEETLTQEAKVA